MEITDALRRYTEQLQANGAAESTRAQAQRQIGKLATWLATEKRSTDIAKVRPDDVAAFLASDAVRMRETGGARKVTSANVFRTSIRCFFKFVHDAGLAPENAARLVKLARCQPPRPKPVNDVDLAKLLAALDTAVTPSELRDRALFRTMAATGIRLGTAIALDVEDFDPNEATLRLRTLKNGGEDVVYLADATVALLRAHVGTRRDGPLFPANHGGRMVANSVRARLDLWAERAGIAHLHPHRLRHTRATRLYAETRDLLLVSRSLTHASLASTQIYARLDAARLREAAGRG